MTCPRCAGQCEKFTTTVVKELTLADLNRDGAGVEHYRRAALAGVVACTRCEFVATVADVRARRAV